MPHISVLLPCYNAAPFLSECIASIAQQTFDDFEVIAVDDGSTDETPQLLARWAASDARVQVLSLAHVGLVRSLQIASAPARGDFFARMDADDIAEPNRFQKQLDYLGEHAAIAACGTGVRYFPSEHVRDGARAYEDWLNSLSTPAELARDIFVECPIAHPALMMRARTFRELGGYQDHGWPEDYDLILRFWAAAHELGNVPATLLHWRERPDRMSRVDPRYSLDAFRRCKVFYLTRTLAQGSVVVWGAGPVGKAFARELAQQGTNVRAFVDIDPRKVGQTVYGLPVVPPHRLESYRGSLVLAAVGSPEARAEIRSALRNMQLVEMKDFCAVA